MKKYLFHPIPLLILLVIIFFYKQVFFGEVFYCCDNIAINIPSKVFLVEELRLGRFPLWNPYILSGSPFLADINLGLLYPLNLLYFIFQPFGALSIGVIVDFVIAISGMYVLARNLRLTQFASAIASVVFALSGTMIVYINNVPMLQVAALLPWVAWAWMTFFTHPTKRFYLILVFFLSLQVFAGHPQFTYYTWLFGIMYVLLVSPLRVKQRVVALLSVGGLVFLLSSIQVIPFIEFVRASTRVGRGFSYASFDSLQPLNVFRFMVPRLVGNLSEGTDWLQGGSVYGYVGVLPIIFALFISLKNIHVRFFLLAAVISFILALGKYTPVFYIAYKLVPGLGSFRSPGHFLFLYTFSMAILAGYGIDRALQSKRRKIFLRVLFAAGIMFLFAGALWINWGAYPLLFIPKFRFLAPAVSREIIFLISKNLLLSGVLLLVVRFANMRAVLLFIVFLELFLFSRDGLISVDGQKMSAWLNTGSIMAQRMHEGNTGGYRMFVSPSLYANPVKKQFGVPYVEKETEWQIEIIRTNINMLYHLSTIDGYAALIYRPYKEMFQKGEGDPTGVDFGNMRTIPWNNLGVRYVLAGPNEDVFKNNPIFVPIYRDTNKVLYKNSHALPVTYSSSMPKSVIIGFWLTMFGLIIYVVLIRFVKERKR